MKKLYVLVLFLVNLFFVNGQRISTDYFPKTPDAFSFSKVAELGNTSYNGSYNIDIPIYTIEVDGLTIPITISYNTSSIKLNEVASKVGLGWSLNIGGIHLSQQVYGKNDLRYGFKDVPDNFDPNGNNQDDYTVRDGLGILGGFKSYDLKPDIFSFSTLKNNGKFFKNISIPNKDVLFKYNNSIIDSDGTIYNFYQQTSSSNSTCQSPGDDPNNIFTFDILNIVTSNKDSINFKYPSNKFYNAKYWTNSQYNNRISYKNEGPDDFRSLPRPEECHSYTNLIESPLEEIKFKKGIINFFYNTSLDEERKDLENGKYLKRIVVLNNTKDTIKDYSFLYDFINSGEPLPVSKYNVFKGVNYRMFLNSIKDNLINKSYKFEYYSGLKKLPNRTSNSYDFWSIFNGENSTVESRVASTIYRTSYVNPTSNHSVLFKGANRYPNFNYGIIGNLKSLEYPTGGKKELFYEPDEYLREFTELDKYFNYTLNFSNVHTTSNTNSTVSYEFNLPKNSYNTNLFFYSEDYPIEGNPPANVQSCKLKFYKYPNYTTPYYTLNSHKNQFDPITFYNTLPEGKYKVEITSGLNQNTFEKINCISYTEWDEVHYIQEEETRKIGTLRLKEIQNKDSNGILMNVKKYKYDDPNTGKSSGINQGEKIFSSINIEEKPINYNNGYSRSLYLTDNPGWNFNLAFGKPIGYSYTTEEFINVKEPINSFKKLYKYSNLPNSYNDYNPYSIINYDFPVQQLAWGNLEKEILFNTENDTILKKEFLFEEDYHFNQFYDDIQTNKIGNGLEINLKYVGSLIISGFTVYFPYYDFQLYPIRNFWRKNTKSITTEYFPNGNVVTTTENNYSPSYKHLYPTNTTSKNSKGETITTEYQYPPDWVGNTMADKLTAQNRISEPLTIVQKNNGIVISAVYNEYNEFNGIVQKSRIFQKKGSSSFSEQDVKITYNSYDTKGNLTQYTLENGIPVAIIWGYGGQYPVAKIEGAALSQISNATILALNTKTTDSELLTAITALRTTHKDAMITGYLYKPLVGVTQIIQPNGMTEKYHYDTANRLKSIVNDQNEVIKTFEYNYKQP